MMNVETSSTLKTRWQTLCRDDRGFFKRLLLAAFPAFLLSYTLLFFGPIDIFLSNSRFFNIYYTAFLGPFSLMFLAAFAALTLVLSLLRGRLYDFFHRLVLALALCLYVQGNFLNPDLGALDGTAIQWQLYTAEALVNLVLWFVIIAAVFAISFIFEKYYRQLSIFLCVLLLGMQTAALVAGMAGSSNDNVYSISAKGQYSLAEEDNIIVFVLDAFSNQLMAKVLQDEPTALDAYKDFVYFDNYNSGYVATFPGELYMITGWNYDFSMTYNENFDSAWSAERTTSYFSALQQAGYSNRIYTATPNYLAGSSIGRMRDSFSNVVVDDCIDLTKENIKQFAQLSLYRYMPLSMKASFWLYSGDIQFLQADGNVNVDHTFVEKLRGDGISVEPGSEKYITYYMLLGSHGPFTMDAQGNYVDYSDMWEQAKGFLVALGEYFEQMKALGIYDDATIIVTADHGRIPDTQAIFLIKEPGAEHDKVQYDHSPTSQYDFLSTILRAAELDYSDYGISVFDYPEGAEVERTVFLYLNDNDFPDLPEGHGIRNTMEEYRYTGDNDNATAVIESGDCITHRLIDSFY